MFTEDRYSHILNKITEKGRVKVTELAEEMGVSEVTVRKDLTVLEERDFLKRNFGGAVSLTKHVKTLSYAEKKIDNIDLKQIIAEKANKLLKNNLDIFLDAGTTSLALVEEIVKYEGITVITYDLNLAYELAKYSNVNTYLVGGLLEQNTLTLLSIDGYNLIENIHADICFAGTDAFDDKNVYSTNNLKARIKSKMLDNSKIRVLISDSSKYKKDGLYSYYKIKDFDYILTDKQNGELNNMLEKQGYL
ncbi:DeoR/GlpR family DNA-binding transcription regulator [Helcococcus sueciensis]|uniref:DeoR/GlpR family DNA-binding transcription regulator n=1 Tax=Helcococcus sueciensis TaxID=241555 RepID=UPI000419250A|nr:DeoR/GlpR family DNA-binding transcription regulator [Helcococcus sueciensis]